MLGVSTHSFFEHLVEDQLVQGIFKLLDECLTNAYDQVVRQRRATLLLVQCEASKLVELALNCGYTITDELYQLSSNTGSREKFERNVRRYCSP